MTRSHNRTTTTNAPTAPANCQSSVVKSRSFQHQPYQRRPPDVSATANDKRIVASSELGRRQDVNQGAHRHAGVREDLSSQDIWLPVIPQEHYRPTIMNATTVGWRLFGMEWCSIRSEAERCWPRSRSGSSPWLTSSS